MGVRGAKLQTRAPLWIIFEAHAKLLNLYFVNFSLPTQLGEFRVLSQGMAGDCQSHFETANCTLHSSLGNLVNKAQTKNIKQ